ncbi:MAG: FtsX-like permease family protein [Candidatus Competibacteraceae bacterium]|jgi:putative ABC transport system permease protein|nr:FtsX-like permease family protein [Candidatus Competibacteraceae bacterium]
MVNFVLRDLRGSGRSLWMLFACLLLGVTLIAASGGLLQQVRSGLLTDTRALFGGDIEISQRSPLNDQELVWLRANGRVSLLIELRTMLMTADGQSQVVELQSFDDNYPLYGEVTLDPPLPLDQVLAKRDGLWGAVIDPVLAERLNLSVGELVTVGGLTLALRALVIRQPDRSLSADWRGPPVLLADQALSDTGLLQPGSLLDYEYRVRIDQNLDRWRANLTTAFPDADWEVRTFKERSRRLGEVLDQVGSALLLIGFSALFIGGLGVSNSVHTYLQSKLATLATLRALGMREVRVARLYLGQVLLLAGLASIAGAVLGGGLALAGVALAAERLPLAPTLLALIGPLLIAMLFGLLTALTFALPALGRAMAVTPAALFRGIDANPVRTPTRYRWLTLASGLLTAGLMVLALPQPLFGIGFLGVTLTLLILLEGVVQLLRLGALHLTQRQMLVEHFYWRLALANLYRPGAPLRPTLLSLGSALTLLVASTLVVAALLRTINDTIPEQAPSLIFYDVLQSQVDNFRKQVLATSSLDRLDLAPLVLGRLNQVNGDSLRDSTDLERVLEARDEHKLSYRLDNFDNVQVKRGSWWHDDYQGPPLVAMEDREADQLGLKVGDRLTFTILGETIEADLVAIYGQKRFQSRFWLEGIFSDGVLEPFISRYVGAIYTDPAAAVKLQDTLAVEFPNVVTVRTESVLREARTLLTRASSGLALVAAISLLASLLVLSSVVAGSRARQVYDATVLHSLGARLNTIHRALGLEQVLLALLTSLFALVLGGLIAWGLLEYRLELEIDGVWWTALIVAPLVSGLCLGLGTHHLLRRLNPSPAVLLQS